ncbi:MAG: transketolase C-terminal domain-containing protein [Pseudomonadota bacterium]|nr:pyruvate ferredoxin oxidoreductase [Pseudomonadota bacterium]MBU1570252.1 pyruvate ferredoxin oxidoreductase [Pseudomonadota bacterium]
MQVEQVVEGSEAVAMAVCACRPQVISAYPISPQTHIVEGLARMVADGELSSEFVRVESEFSAASVLAGASAAGSRSYTASSSQGLLLMTEVLYASAGMRLPFVITGVNRSISAPINIQIDQQDTMSLRDAGLIQFYVESVQEAYDMHLAAFKIAESPDIMLPVMVCMDGWVLTHSYERVQFVDQADVDRFLPQFAPPNYLTPDDPKTWGSYAEAESLMEFKYAVHHAMQTGKQRIRSILEELEGLTGRSWGGLIEAYRTADAEVILVALGSVTGTIKESVDQLRKEGKAVGLVKIRCYRPFPYEDIWTAINRAKVVAVLDANCSMGSAGALSMDLKSKFCGLSKAPRIVDMIAGLGGREINPDTVANIVAIAESVADSESMPREPIWIDLNTELIV